MRNGPGRVFPAVALLMAVLASATSAATTPAQKVDEIFAKLDSRSEPGCAVGVFQDGKALLARGFGMADIAAGQPIDSRTLLYAASNSKQFTALAVAKLVEQGKLQLGDDVRKWLPELPDYGQPITLAMLMGHSSGLGNYLQLFELAGMNRFDTIDVPAAMQMIVRQRTLAFAPGTGYGYSNSGYLLLAVVVQRASGMSFQEYVRKTILAPLGMNDTFLRDGAANPSKAPLSHGYVKDAAGRWLVKDSYPSISGSGGVMLSLDDLRKLDRDFHTGHKVWTATVRQIMLTPARLASGEPLLDEDGGNYGAGLHLATWRGRAVVAHDGGAQSYRSRYVRFPELEFSVALFCNRADMDVRRYVSDVVLAYRSQDFTAEEPPRERKSTPVTTALAPPTVLALEGRYRSQELNAEYSFERSGEGLRVRVFSPYIDPAGRLLEDVPLQLGPDKVLLDNLVLALRPRTGEPVQAFLLSEGVTRNIRFERSGAASAAFSDCDGCPSMVRIPAGENLMGTSQQESSAEGYAQWPEHESPVHAVKVAAFALARHEVTRAQYAAFVAETRRPDPGKCVHLDANNAPIVVAGGSFRNAFVPQVSEREPVVCVSWDDASAYAAWLAKKTGKPYRLPTEAEWEYAARAGTQTSRYFGDAKVRDRACEFASVADFKLAKGLNGIGVSDAPDNVFQCDDGYVYLSPVGTFAPNGFGLYDMLGNVSEWVLDCYHVGYTGAPADGSEWRGDCAVVKEEIQRVARGGAFGTDPRKVRAAWRSPGSPMAAFHTGFRVALSESAEAVAREISAK